MKNLNLATNHGNNGENEKERKKMKMTALMTVKDKLK